MNLDAMCQAARRRLHKYIERMTQINLGRHPHTVNRSVGQLYSKRWAHKRLPK